MKKRLICTHMALASYQEQSLFTSDAQFGRAPGRKRTRTFLLNTLLSLIVLLALSSASLAQSALTDDAHVFLLQGNANHGTDPNLNVSSTENIYLKFKFSSTLPAATRAPRSRALPSSSSLAASRLRASWMFTRCLAPGTRAR